MINLLAIFASEDGKQLLSHLYVAIFSVCAEKCTKDAEDAEIGELCGSAPPHPVRCPIGYVTELILNLTLTVQIE